MVNSYSNPETEVDQFGRFTILGELGQGGQAVVLLVEDPELHRLIALKLPDLETLRERGGFRNEAYVTEQICHPNIVQVYESSHVAGIPYLAMEYCEGKSLHDWLNHRKRWLEAKDIAALMLAVAHGLEAIHGKGFIHRDLKPGNILLARRDSQCQGDELADYIPKIADFGLAVSSDRRCPSASTRIFGTISYMSPEQFSGSEANFGPASDLYSLGVISQKLLEHASGGIPKPLKRIIARCVQENPRDRYSSAIDLIADLKRFLDDLPKASRRKTLAVVIFAFAVAILFCLWIM